MNTLTRRNGKLRVLVLPIIATVTSLTLGGCSLLSSDDTSSEPRGPLSIVHSVRANQPVRNLESSPEIKQVIDEHLGSSISIVTSDGVPQLLTTYDTTPKANNPTTEKRERSRLRKKLFTYLHNEATTPETDPLNALSLAANALQSHSQSRTILMIDSGLATAGALSFQNSHLLHKDTDITQAVNMLESAHALPQNLSGVHVIWVGLGQTQEPQKPLDEATSQRLKTVWTEILTRSGAEVKFIDTPLPSMDGNQPTLPAVSPLEVEQFTLTAPKVSLNLNDTTLNFAPDSASFLDPSKAQQALSDTVQHIHKAGNPPVNVTACTATWGEEAYRVTLSQQRAAAVSAILTDAGITVATSQGLGSNCPGKVTDVDANGELIEDLAKLNRRVIITSAS